MSNFDTKPADANPEEDRDAMWDRWFKQQERNGMAVLSRDEWDERLTDAYADGRKDEREEWAPVLAALRELVKAARLSRLTDGQRSVECELADQIVAADAAIARATGEQQ